MNISDIPKNILDPFRKGVVIPAMPLALDTNRRFDEMHQKAILRYYMDAGAGGIAVGVHSTQFAIRDPRHGLFEPLLRFCSETVDHWSHKTGRNIIKIAGICGNTQQAEQEAGIVLEAGYHVGLLSLSALGNEPVEELIRHCRMISEIIPVMGFYLQPSVGGRILPRTFWSRFAELDNIIGIKIAPFSRYQTLDVIRGICDAGRKNDITLYTGNDDNIVPDLLTEYVIETVRGNRSMRIRGGLLGHWAVWTRRAVELLEEIHGITDTAMPVPQELLTRSVQITDCNAAIFDAANAYKGCIPGIHEILYRQGLLSGITCLSPEERLSPGQSEEIDRICSTYPHLNDDDYVHTHIDRWLNA